MSFLEQIPKKSNLSRNVLGIFKTTVESPGWRYLYKADCLRPANLSEPTPSRLSETVTAYPDDFREEG